MSARSLRFAVISAVVCVLVAVVSCTEDGVTSNCPALPLYQSFALGDASPPDAGSPDSPKTAAALASAVSAGCATPPTSGVVASSLGGAAGTGGSGGAAGHSAGGTSAGGNTSSENAGAAGSN